ncbi:hypothetical protein [Timonella senegalensis]|uniref:hypothetical protein n=1 Tax=Timonella senegalensis TaxID=1465825 RepID=UPI002FDD6DC9
MSTNYLPFTHEIRSAAVVGLTPHIHRRALGITVLEAEKIAMHSFDSWIANEKRKAKIQVLEEAANDVFETALDAEVAHWLRARARQLKEEA